MYIYKTTNLLNQKIYVGKSKRNIDESRKYLGSGKLIKRAIKKYGRENFKKEIITLVKTLEELNEKEVFWIEKLNTIKNGYNLTKGGDGGDTISIHPNKKDIIERQKITKIKKGVGKGKNNPRYGKHLSLDQKRNLSQIMKDKYAAGEINRYRMTDEGRRKISKWMKENCPTKTPEGRRKNRENNIGAKNPNAHIYEFIDPDNKIIIIEGGIKQFCKKKKIPYKQIIKIYDTNKDYKGWRCKKISKVNKKI